MGCEKESWDKDTESLSIKIQNYRNNCLQHSQSMGDVEYLNRLQNAIHREVEIL
jgi:hypothetical protein